MLEKHYDYCPVCGQENHDILVPIGHVLYEFLEGITHFDTKVWNTIKSIFTKPGQITDDFLSGKRARYVPPPRFYIFISVIFFILLSNISHELSENFKNEYKRAKYLTIFVGNNSYRIKENQAKLLLCLDIDQVDSILIKEENTRVRNIDLFRRILRDSLIVIEEKKLKNNSQEIIKTLLDDGSVDVDFSIGGDKDTVRNVDKDSLLVSKKEDEINRSKIYEIDSLYSRQICKKLVAERRNRDENNILSIPISKEEEKQMEFMSTNELDSLAKFKHHELLAKGESSYLILLKAVLRNYTKFKNLDFDKLFTNTIKSFSVAMFLFMPVIALITWIFFRKRKYFVEHLIYSIHIHAFTFLIFSLNIILINYFPSIFKTATISLTFLGLMVYIIISLKKVFNSSWSLTIFKFFVISFIYIILLCLVVLGAFLMGALT